MSYLKSLPLETLEEQEEILTIILERGGELSPEREEALWRRSRAIQDALASE